jgi:hypothetical protein
MNQSQTQQRLTLARIAFTTGNPVVFGLKGFSRSTGREIVVTEEVGHDRLREIWEFHATVAEVQVQMCMFLTAKMLIALRNNGLDLMPPDTEWYGFTFGLGGNN